MGSVTVREHHPNAAGIDIGSMEHYVAVPADRDPRPVRSFLAFTADLHRLADWLTACRIDAVVMESTGSYWIPLFELLEARGFTVWLVDPHGLKQVPGRKSDVRDCQWLQYLHSVGLLSAAFRPAEEVVVLRTYLRQRANLVKSAAREIVGMQTALTHMNLKLQHVVSDISGVTGMAIIRAILAGERDPHRLAALRDGRCKNDAATIAAALEGSWRDEHLFALKQAVGRYDFQQEQIAECDEQIMACLGTFPSRANPQDIPPAPPKRKRDRKSRHPDLRAELFRICGVDLTHIDGIDDASALTLISEVGLDMSRWKSAKHFASWLRLSPPRDVSGGKVLKRRRPRPAVSRASTVFRMCAQSLHRSQTALGAFYRRKRAQDGPAKAITAAAHKLARLFYALLRSRSVYVDPGVDYYEQRYRERALANLTRRAHTLGMRLVPATAPTT